MLGEIAISACRSIFEKENKLLANWILGEYPISHDPLYLQISVWTELNLRYMIQSKRRLMITERL